MPLSNQRPVRPAWGRRAVWLPAALCLWFARDVPAHALVEARGATDTPLFAEPRPGRIVSWTQSLQPIDVESVRTQGAVRLRLYDENGELDDVAKAAFERVANNGDGHDLVPRLQQLVVKAARHFERTHGITRVIVVSAWRDNAGRHTTGEAVDFKIDGVRAAQLAAYLRGLPQAGVGLYTHPRTQFVHLDVRETSYHWIDSSPPGMRGREGPLADRGMKRRDAAYVPAMDLPL